MGKGKKQGCDLGLGLASTSRGWEEELIAILDEVDKGRFSRDPCVAVPAEAGLWHSQGRKDPGDPDQVPRASTTLPFASFCPRLGTELEKWSPPFAPIFF